MATVLQEFFGKFPIGASTDSFVVGSNALTLTAGYYYTDGYTGETTAQLCNHVQAIIRAGSTHTNALVTYSHTTARVTIGLASNAVITWTDSGLATILGFPTAATSSLQSHTGNAQPRYVWRPSVAASQYSTSLTGQTWAPVSTTKYLRANDGSVHSVAGATLYETEFSYDYLPLADAIQASPQTYKSFQEWFTDVVCGGLRIRFYRDRTLNTSADVEEAIWGGEEPGKFIEIASRNLARFNGYWRLSMPLWKWV